jgi:hypothetical protein
MKSLQPEADGISRLLSANERNSNGSQEIAEGDFLKAKTGDYGMKILVIGGTGNVGGEVVKELQNRNADIRLLLHREGDGSPKGVEVAIADLLDPVSVRKALHGVDKLYLLNAVAPDELTQGLIAYDLAKRLKLKHIVYHSVFRVEHFKDVPHFASKLAIENAVPAVRCTIHDCPAKLLQSERRNVERPTHAGWHLPHASGQCGRLGSGHSGYCRSNGDRSDLGRTLWPDLQP